MDPPLIYTDTPALVAGEDVSRHLKCDHMVPISLPVCTLAAHCVSMEGVNSFHCVEESREGLVTGPTLTML